jgi:hypothetical protein
MGLPEVLGQAGMVWREVRQICELFSKKRVYISLCIYIFDLLAPDC